MTTKDRKRIARELTSELLEILLMGCGRMPVTWDGRHVRAFAGMVIARFNNHPSVRQAEREIKKSDIQYFLDY